MRRVGLLLAAVLLPAATATAHVEVEPARAPAGGEARLTFEVPNERGDAATRRIVIQMPGGVTSVAGVALRGWKLTTRPPEGSVRRATLTAPRGRELTGEQRGRFRLLVGLPQVGGKTVTFKVLQVYDSGEIVRWLGPEGTSEPAPTLRLTAPTAAAVPPPAEAEAPPQPAQAQPSQNSDGGDDDGGVPIWAGVGLILLAAIAGSSLARRRNRRRVERDE